RRGFIAGSGMPSLAATVISRASLPNSFDLAASWRPLRCMMFLNCECPAMAQNRSTRSAARAGAVTMLSSSREGGLIGRTSGKIQPNESIPERRPRRLQHAAEADRADPGCEPARIVGLDRKPAQRRRPQRGLELGCRDLAQEATDRLVLRHADHR